MIEGIDITQLVASGGVTAVMALWIVSLRARLAESEERCERINSEFINYLRSDRQRQNDIEAEVRFGQRMSMIDTQKIPTPDEIDRALNNR